MTISPGSPVATSLSHSSTTRTSTPGAGRTWRFVIQQYAYHLGHSPHLDEGETETPLEHAVKLRLYAGAKAEANRMTALFSAFGHAEQKRYDYPEIVNDRGLRLADFRPPSARMKPVSLDLAASTKHSAMERQNGRVDVIHGQGVINPLTPLAKRCEMTARRIPCPRFELVADRKS